MSTERSAKQIYDAEYYRRNRDRRRAQNDAWMVANKDRHDAMKRADRLANPEKFRARAKAWAQANRAKASERTKRWLKKNSAYHAATRAKRHAARLQRTPCWLSATDREAILWMYLLCAAVTKQSGLQHCVDHICPLQGEGVCGLHVPWNLQILTRSENAEKHNRWSEEGCLPAFL